MPTLLTVVLNYKTPDMSLKAVESALREIEGIDGEIVLVDNDSRDGSFEKMRDAVAERGWDRVRVRQSGHNGGYGAGNNFGIRAGLSTGETPDYVYVLNSDAFPDAGAVRILMETLEADPAIGFAGSNIHGPGGEWHCSTFRFPSILSEFEGALRLGPVSRLLRRWRVPMDAQPTELTRVDWTAGASLMMRWTTLEQIGLFDETFFLYFEETDLCRRAAKAGWDTVYVPESRVTHIGSVSTGMRTWQRMPQYWFDSRWYYFHKNHGLVYAAVATKVHVVAGLMWRLRRLIQRKPRQDADHFLQDLVAHAVKSAFGPARTPRNDRPAGVTMTATARD